MGASGPIVVIGSINMDLVCRTPRLPGPGETVMGTTFATVPGGKGANQAVAAARTTLTWGRALAAQSNVPVLFVDERLSSFAAEQTLLDRKRAGEKLTRQRKKEQLDAVAAATFLQQFLDGRLPPLDVGSIVTQG